MNTQALLSTLLLALVASAVPYGQIKGVVVGSDGRPVPYATVEAKGRDGQTVSAAVADEAGKFDLVSLAEGRYILSASKAAHVDALFGATVAGAPGVPIYITDGDVVTGIKLELHQGSVIAGQVAALDGVSLPWHRVDLFRLARSGRREAIKKFMTDDRGQFRAFGLPPGRYAVCVSRTRLPFESGVISLTEQLVEDLFAVLAKGKQPAAADVRTTSSVETHHDGVSCVGDSPGTEIDLGPGQVKEGMSVMVLPVRVSRVSGSAQRASTVMLMPTSSGPAVAPRESRVDAAGRFAIDGVVPGTYRLVAVGTTPGPEAGVLDLVVSGGDVEGIVIPLNALVPLSGRIVLGEGAGMIDPSGLTVNLMSGAENRSATRLPRGSIATVVVEPSTRVRPDGGFAIQGVVPGTYRIQIDGLPAGWRLRSLNLGNRRLDAGTLDLTLAGSVVDLVAFIDASNTGVIGAVTAETHLRASDHMVLAFPRDPSTWGDPNVFKLGVPDQRGHYELNGMSPGAYWLVAAPPMTLEALIERPDVLQALAQRASPIELADGTVLNVPLTIGGMW